MIHVIEIMEGGRVTVDAKDLCRVEYNGEVVAELISRERADNIASIYSKCALGGRAVVKCYAELAQSASNCSAIIVSSLTCLAMYSEVVFGRS